MVPQNQNNILSPGGVPLRDHVRRGPFYLIENAVSIAALIYLTAQLVRWGFNGFAL